MVYCCVPFCKSESGKSKGIGFHEIPCDIYMRVAWLEAISRKDYIPNDRSNSSRVCSKHFKEDDYKTRTAKKRRLKPKAVPSIFPHYTLVTIFPEEKSGRNLKRQLDDTTCVSPKRRPAILGDTSNLDRAPSENLGNDFSNDERQLQKSTEKNIDCHENNTINDHRTPCINIDVSRIESIEESPTSSTEMTIPDISESRNNSNEITISSVESGNSAVTKYFPSTTFTSDDVYIKTIKSEIPFSAATSFENVSLGPSISKYIPFTIINSVPSATVTSTDVQFKIVNLESSSHSTDKASGEVPLAAAKSKDTSLGSNNLENVIENNLNGSRKIQRQWLNSISEPENGNVSEQIVCVTHAEAFSAAQTLLHYLMNQDDANNTDINLILNLAQNIKNKIVIKTENLSTDL